MNLFLLIGIFFVALYLLLNFFVKANSKKIVKSLRFIIIIASIFLAVISFLGKYAFSIPVLILLLPLLKLKGLSFFQMLYLFRLLNYLRQTGRFNFTSGANYSKPSSNLTIEDSYNILGLKRGCSKEVVLSKYKKILQKLHPDANQDTDTTKLAQIVSEAKETIIKQDFS